MHASTMMLTSHTALQCSSSQNIMQKCDAIHRSVAMNAPADLSEENRKLRQSVRNSSCTYTIKRKSEKELQYKYCDISLRIC